MILFAAGDPGGSRAILAVAIETYNRAMPSLILKNGFLASEVPHFLVDAVVHVDVYGAEKFLIAQGVSCVVLGSSTTDTVPLSFARAAHLLNIPVVHILDNWSNYRSRLEMDGFPFLCPTIYTVMDDEALHGATSEGVPLDCLRVTGHPGLSAIVDRHITSRATSRTQHANILGLPTDKLLLAFINEPLREVRGTDVTAANHCGYTEDEVLAAWAEALKPFADEVFACIIPHPKQPIAEVTELWRSVAGNINGTVIKPPKGHMILPAVSGVAGMASILLYEAWLLGIPAIAMQPNCCLSSMTRFEKLEGIFYSNRFSEVDCTVADWLHKCRDGQTQQIRSDGERHKNSPSVIADMISNLVSRRI